MEGGRENRRGRKKSRGGGTVRSGGGARGVADSVVDVIAHTLRENRPSRFSWEKDEGK